MDGDDSENERPLDAHVKHEPAPTPEDAPSESCGTAEPEPEPPEGNDPAMSPSQQEACSDTKAGKQLDVIWGPQYSLATAKYVVGSRDSNSHPSKYRHDEVFDFLRGERVGEPVYPCRLREAGATRQRLKEFRKSVRRSFALTENEGELVLMHEVLPGHRASGIEGSRSPSHGLKVVPTKAMAKILVCKEHAEMHYGSTITDLNNDYVIPSGFLLEVRADVKRQCKLCGELTNAAAAATPPPRRLFLAGMRPPSHMESGGGQSAAAETSSSHHEQECRDGGGGGGGGSGSGGEARHQPHQLNTRHATAAHNGDGPPEEAQFRRRVPASCSSSSSSSSSAGPPVGAPTVAAAVAAAAAAAAAAARSQENASRWEGASSRSSRKRPLPPDPKIVILDELSVDTVTNAVLGIPHPDSGVQHPYSGGQHHGLGGQHPGSGGKHTGPSGVQPPGEDHLPRVSVVVWNVGHCGDGHGSGLLPRLVDRLVRSSVVDKHTRVLVVDDATSSGLDRRHRGCDGDARSGVSNKRSHDEVVTATVEAAMHAMKVYEDDEVSKTTLEAYMAREQFLDSAKFITTGTVEVFLESEPALPDKIKAHLLRRGRPSVVLAREDPSLPPQKESGRHPRVLTGKRICRVKEARTEGMAHTPDREWDHFLRDTRLLGRCSPSRSKCPSVETLQAFLCRSGATLTKGIVVVASDPFAAWAEACARLQLSCVTFVGANPTADVRSQVERMWRKTTAVGGVPR